MNERIKELALEAGKYADETQPRGSYTRDGMWLYAFNEKFAQLIVQECVRVIQAQNDDENDLDSWDRGFVAGLATAIDAIEQHFGVES